MANPQTSIGVFITFEGGEGSGKSTQSRKLLEVLQQRDIPVIHTREPGGTEGAEAIRKLLVEGPADKWDRETEILLHMAARRDHTEKLVKPALNEGKVVICDRYIDSTTSYQGYGHGLPFQAIDTLRRFTIGNFAPNLTFILDIDVKDGIDRAGKRNSIENRYESMALEFHERVRQGFLTLAEQEPERCVLLDATQGIDEIHQQIIAEIRTRLSISL